MFQLPRYVIKAGQVIVDDGDIRESVFGKTLHVAPEFDHEIESDISDWFEQYYSIRFRNYPVDEGYLHDSQVVDCEAKED